MSLFSGDAPTVIYTHNNSIKYPNAESVIVNTNQSIVSEITNDLFNRNIQSLVVEGGTQLIELFIKQGMWDEARVIVGNKWFGNGLKAPFLNHDPLSSTPFSNDTILYFRNHNSHKLNL